MVKHELFLSEIMKKGTYYHDFNILLEVLIRGVKVKIEYKIYDLEGRNKMENTHRLSLSIVYYFYKKFKRMYK